MAAKVARMYTKVHHVPSRIATSRTLRRTIMMLSTSGPEAATRLLSFVNASPTPYHAVHNAATKLEKAGFTKVRLLRIECRTARVLSCGCVSRLEKGTIGM